MGGIAPKQLLVQNQTLNCNLTGDHKWHEGPPLRKARYFTSACSLGTKAYLFFGQTAYDEEQDSIECLDIENEKIGWQVFKLPGVRSRQHPIVCPINDKEIVIFGGNTDALNELRFGEEFNMEEYERLCRHDMFVMDTEARTAKLILPFTEGGTSMIDSHAMGLPCGNGFVAVYKDGDQHKVLKYSSIKNKEALKVITVDIDC